MKKTYIVRYTKRNRGLYRDYTKVVKTNDIVDYVINKMKMSLITAGTSDGMHKGLFLFAIEVEESDKEYYKYRKVNNGEYWYLDRDENKIVKTIGTASPKYYGMVK